MIEDFQENALQPLIVEREHNCFNIVSAFVPYTQVVHIINPTVIIVIVVCIRSPNRRQTSKHSSVPWCFR
jgi:hypothetical protein